MLSWGAGSEQENVFTAAAESPSGEEQRSPDEQRKTALAASGALALHQTLLTAGARRADGATRTLRSRRPCTVRGRTRMRRRWARRSRRRSAAAPAAAVGSAAQGAQPRRPHSARGGWRSEASAMRRFRFRPRRPARGKLDAVRHGASSGHASRQGNSHPPARPRRGPSRRRSLFPLSVDLWRPTQVSDTVRARTGARARLASSALQQLEPGPRAHDRFCRSNSRSAPMRRSCRMLGVRPRDAVAVCAGVSSHTTCGATARR